MVEQMKGIAIIPARSGSKGLKDKNIKMLNGKPLLSYTIEAAIESKIFEKVIVSTDSMKYAEVAKRYGADVPFLRKKELAMDNTSSWNVVKDVLLYEKKNEQNYDICALLQPTSPLRKSGDIKNAYKMFCNKNANAVISICEVEHPIQWCFQIDSDFDMKSFSNSICSEQRQSMPIFYRENGAIYLLKTNLIMESTCNIYKEKCYGYIMDNRNSIDIDSIIDFKLAEILQKEEYKM